jgi:hypothetical protein
LANVPQSQWVLRRDLPGMVHRPFAPHQARFTATFLALLALLIAALLCFARLVSSFFPTAPTPFASAPRAVVL